MQLSYNGSVPCPLALHRPGPIVFMALQFAISLFYQQQTLLQTLTVCRDLIFLFRFYVLSDI